MGLKVLVISDLHCRHSKIEKIRDKATSEPPNTWLFSDAMRLPSKNHPVQAFLELVYTNKNLKFDLLLCPGDITDQIDPQGLITGWSLLEEIKRAVHAENFYLTLGNHDVDLYRIEGPNAFDYVERLKYNFPFVDNKFTEKYLKDNFCYIKNLNYSILIFNSVYNYKHTKDNKKIDIDSTTLEKLEKELKDDSNKIKIAMLHHHPIQHRNIDYNDNDYLNNGDAFLKILKDNNFSIVVHGHKHEPRCISYQNIPILGAGSFSSRANIQETNSLNMFHIIEFHDSDKGIIESWSYHPTRGWSDKIINSFPIRFGFGSKIDIKLLAKKIDHWVGKKANIYFKDLIVAFPEIKYILASDLFDLENYLKDKFKIIFYPGLLNNPDYISNLKVK